MLCWARGERWGGASHTGYYLLSCNWSWEAFWISRKPELRASLSFPLNTWKKEKARVGCFERIALNMYIIICETDRQSRFDAWDRALRAGALGWPRGMGWGGRWEGGSGWGTHVHPCLIHVNVWQNPPQYYKVISLQLKKKKKQKEVGEFYKEEGGGIWSQCACVGFRSLGSAPRSIKLCL